MEFVIKSVCYLQFINTGKLMRIMAVTLIISVLICWAGAYGQDDYQLEVVGQVDTPGQAQAVATFDTYAFVADMGEGLSIFDLAQIWQPIYVNSYNPGGFVNDVIVSGNYAYLARWNLGITVMDLSIPQAPDSVGGFNTSGTTIDIFLEGDLLYAADLFNGLVILDVSDAANIQQVGHIPAVSFTASVAVDDTVFYVSEQGFGLVTYSLADTANPVLRSSFPLSVDCDDLVINGNYLYLACGLGGMLVFDITDPLNPDSLTQYNTSGSANKIMVTDTIAYIAEGSSGLTAVSIGNPAAPYHMDTFNSPGSAMGTATFNDFILLADEDTLFVIYTSEPNGINEDKPIIPDKIKIINCYPNPFNPSVTISFEIDQRTEMSLDIYNSTGRLVTNLVSGYFNKGRHTLDWNASGCASGVYFIKVTGDLYNLQNGNYTTAKVIYLK